MEEKLNNSKVVELSLEEKKEINAGSERKDDKLNSWFENFWNMLKG